ncbi:MAG: hypothetical protein ACRENS_06775 [Candidatus Eiseniibacteriota bacterium]
MNSRVRWVGGAVLVLLTVASACLAAEPPAGAIAADTSGAVPSAPRRGDRPGFGGVGGQMGVGYVPGYQDYSKYAQVRMSFAANWRYTMSPSWRWQVSPGFVWTGYSKHSNPAPFQDPNFPTDPYKDEYLVLVLPVSAQLQWIHRGQSLVWHVGAGPGAYRVWVENHRKVVPDPITFDHHKGIYWGGTAEAGFEHFFKSLPTTSWEVTVDAHYIDAKRDDQFPSGYNSAALAMGLRAGANYYFSLKPKPKASETPLPLPPK